MKKLVAVLALAAVTMAGIQTASAHDRGWSTTGKVLTGLFAASVISQAIAPPPPVVYAPRAPVYYSTPAPVYNSYVPAPVYTTPAPVYVAPAPVYVPPPVVVAPPVVGFRFGFGFGHPHHFHHRW